MGDRFNCTSLLNATIILSSSEPEGTLHLFCLVQYAFTGEEHAIDVPPHGNCKTSSRSFVRTLESTKKELVEVSSISKPKETFHKVLQLEGNNNLCNIRSVGAIPKSREQGSKLRDYSTSTGKNISSPCPTPFKAPKDPWYNLLLECKRQGDNATFIRTVKLAPEPSCVLATNRQLHDIARFCCDPFQYSPLTVDPTFNLGPYNVTIVTYKHLILKNRRDGSNPCLLGPVMIHSRKTRESYSQLCSTMRTLEPTLKNLLAFGTDEEKALIDAFESNFDSAVHVLCTRHLRNTFKTHFRRLGVSETIQQQMLNDVFGNTWDGVQQKGLIDATTEAQFNEMCERMREEWATKYPAGLQAFQWFKENKAKVLVEKAIAPVRRQAGLGDPPGKFYTNQSESSNHLVQSFVQEDAGSKKVDEYVFCKTLEKLVQRQTVDIELAVTNRGPYEMSGDYNELLISEDKWVKMTPKQRETAIAKVHSISLSESNVKKSLTTSLVRHQQSSLENKLFQEGVDWIPSDVLQGMSDKAENLLQDRSNLVVAPGSQNTLVVPSQSCPQTPRLVHQQASGRITCSCAQYMSMSICSHSIVYAQFFDVFPSYVKWLKCQRRRKGGDSINISNLANHGMPAGRGRKGGRQPAKKVKLTSPPKEQLSHSPLYPSSRNPCNALLPLSLGQSSSNPSHTDMLLSVGPHFSSNSGHANKPQIPSPQFSSNPGHAVSPSSLGPQSSIKPVDANTPVNVGAQSLSNPSNMFAPLSLGPNYKRIYGNAVSVSSFKDQDQSPMVDVGFSALQTGNDNFMVQQSLPGAAPQTLPLNPLSRSKSTMAFQWHSGLSPHRYELKLLPSNVQKCYGCGRHFVDKYRKAPHNVIIKHVDRRVRGTDTMGNLLISSDFSATYYHLDSKHVERKNPLFSKVVFITNSLFLQLSTDQLQLVHQGGLVMQFYN